MNAKEDNGFMNLRCSWVSQERRKEALEVLYADALPTERAELVEAALEAASLGELDLEGLALAERDGQAVGAILCTLQSDGTMFVWPPTVVPGAEEGEKVADALLTLVRARVDSTPWCAIAQALIEPEQELSAGRLERNGFPHLVDLLFLQKSLNSVLKNEERDRSPLVVTSETFDEARNQQLFARVLERTYEGSLDCPELNGGRTGEEALVSHRGSHWNPALWWLYRSEQGEQVGVALVREHAPRAVWELVYFGIVPEVRGRGFGRAVLWDVLQKARKAGVELVYLSVDVRNRPALNLYKSLGFVELGMKRVFARFGPRWRKPKGDDLEAGQ